MKFPKYGALGILFNKKKKAKPAYVSPYRKPKKTNALTIKKK